MSKGTTTTLQSLPDTTNIGISDAHSSIDSVVHNTDSVSFQPNANEIHLFRKDSSLMEQAADTSLYNNSLFTDPFHQEYAQTSPLHGKAGIRLSSSRSDWLVGVLLISLFLLAVIKFSYNKFLTRVVDSLINNQTASTLFNEKNMKNMRGSMIMNFMFFLNGAVFLFELIHFNQLGNSSYQGFQLFLICLFVLLGIYLVKTISFRLLGYIFNGSRETREYLHSVFLFNKNLGLFLFPVIVGVPFIVPYAVPLLLKGGVALAGCLYLLRLLRGLKILFRKHVSIFYMILYLCALEILPLMMIFKLIQKFT